MVVKVLVLKILSLISFLWGWIFPVSFPPQYTAFRSMWHSFLGTEYWNEQPWSSELQTVARPASTSTVRTLHPAGDGAQARLFP